jgi:hypothetical protein
VKLEIIGKDAQAATEELLNWEGIEGSYETLDEPQKEGIATTIIAIAAIPTGILSTMTIAEKLYNWYQKYQKKDSGKSIENAMIVTEKGRRLLLKNATVEQLKELLDE